MTDIHHRIGVESSSTDDVYAALTTIDWRLSRSDGFTIVHFTHEGWAEPVEFLSHCSTKWAVFLLSLKALIETGTGSPSPDDVPISDWH